MRSLAVLAMVMLVSASTVRAEDRPDAVAPTRAVAAAWQQEGPKPSATLRALIASYGAAQALDMTTTIRARSHGAVETNPMMQGGDAAAMATKAALGVATIAAVHALDRHSRKAAILTMIAANAATFAVAAHNVRVANQLRR